MHSDKELKMPREKVDEVGTHYRGEVLSGETSVEQRRMRETIELLQRTMDAEG
jgi:hypothetical protein